MPRRTNRHSRRHHPADPRSARLAHPSGGTTAARRRRHARRSRCHLRLVPARWRVRQQPRSGIAHPPRVPSRARSVRSREELVSHRLEFPPGKIACGRPVVLPQTFDHDGLQAEMFGDDRCRIPRLPFGAAEQGPHVAEPRLLEYCPAHALPSHGRQRPIRHRHRRIDYNLRMRDEVDDAHISPSVAEFDVSRSSTYRPSRPCFLLLPRNPLTFPVDPTNWPLTRGGNCA